VNEDGEGELLASGERVLVSFWLWFGFSTKDDGGGSDCGGLRLFFCDGLWCFLFRAILMMSV
jgi:hypothetical protein